MEVVHKINDLPMKSCREGDFYTDDSSEIKDDMNPGTHVSLKKPIKMIAINGNVSGRDGEGEYIVDDPDLLKRILLADELFSNNEPHLEAFSKFSNATVLIRDSRQKRLTLQEHQGSAHLVSLFLQGNNQNKEAMISMDALTSSLFTGPTHQVILSIVGHDLYLSCIADEGDQNTPVLSLMKVTGIQDKEDNDLLPFLFQRSANTNNGKNRFESVTFPGWYICTSQAQNQFIEIKPESDQEHISDFLLYPTS